MIACWAAVASASCGAAPIASGQQPTANGQERSAQQPAVPDYVAFMRRLPNGLVNVGALDLPAEFLQRVADRSLRSHFRSLYRQVEAFAPVEAGHSAQATPNAAGAFRVVDEDLPAEVIAAWQETRNEVPELRGFRAPFAEVSGDFTWDMFAPKREDDPAKRAAALTLAEQLAAKGLVRATMEALRTNKVLQPGEEITSAKLASIGVPVDLLAMHVAGGKPVIEGLQQWWNDGGTVAGANELADRARFEFQPTRQSFKVMAEDGSEQAGRIRVQLHAAKYAIGEGDGSPMDVVRQLACLERGWEIVATAPKRELDALLAHANSWPVHDRSGMTIVSTPVFASQWAQDSAKTGLFTRGDGTTAAATLLPRFASVNEQMTKFAAGDSMIFESLRPALGEYVFSPLLFQGGNVMCVAKPGGERLLLLGEAEVHRNRALGLSEKDVLSAFRSEFGVDRCVVVPAVSFHIDVEFTVRRVGDELVAAVGDDIAAARLLLGAALQAFEKAKLIGPAEVQRAVEELQAGKQRDALALTASIAASHISTDGKVGGAFVEALRSPLAAPEAAAGRVMHAMDLLTAVEAKTAGQPLSPNNPHERVYRESLRRRVEERDKLATMLTQLGMRVVRVPNLGDEEQGVNVINAVHLPEMTLVPISGGIYASIDEAAIAAYRQAFGDSIEIIPVTTTYVQSQYGGVHCMVSVYPAASE